MKIASFFFIFFIVITFATISADDERQVRAKSQEIALKPINRNVEIVRAMLNGSSSLTFCVAACYAFLRAKDHLLNSDQKTNDPFLGWLNVFMALTMLELAYRRGYFCIEALKRTFVGYDITQYNQVQRIGTHVLAQSPP
jgi:hypothetical protein